MAFGTLGDEVKMKLDLNEIATNESIIAAELQIGDLLCELEGYDFGFAEQVQRSLPPTELRVFADADYSLADREFTLSNFRKLGQFPNSYGVIDALWGLEFSGNSLSSDLEALASGLMDRPMRLRTERAVAQDSQTHMVGYVYPEAEKIGPGLENLDRFLRGIEMGEGRFHQAVIAWIFLMRLHPFDDGNGRTSRAFFNFACRDLGLISSPTFFLSTIVYSNLDTLAYDHLDRDPIGAVQVYLKLIVTYLEIVHSSFIVDESAPPE